MSTTPSAYRATTRVGTPVGILAVTAGPEGVTAITWADRGGTEGLPGAGAAEAPDLAESGSGDGPRTGAGGMSPAERTAAVAARQISEYVRGERRSFDLVLDLEEGSPFRRRVLEELAGVPYGETVTYGELAERCGRPGAARAVGNAVGRNPAPVVLPCHRVIRSDGTPGNYGGGRERKRQLLRLEGALPGADPAAGPSADPSG